MDLFTPVVDQFRLDKNFVKIACERNRYALDVLQDWARGFPDRDGKFVKEFQTTFESSFWELYLHAVLKHFRLNIDFKYDSPDFVVVNPVELSIEATVARSDANNMQHDNLSLSDIPNDLNAFNQKAIVRLSNSFSAKLAKFKAYYSALPHVSGKPFVLAIAPFDCDYAFLEVHRTIEALLFGYYVDDEKYGEEGFYSKKPQVYQLAKVIKHNGSAIDVGLFNNDSAKEISAVIFSSTATWGKALALSNDPQSQSVFTAVSLNKAGTMHKVSAPKASYYEHLIDGLRVYHNPYAVYHLPTNVFRDHRVFQSYFDDNTHKWIYEKTDCQLIFRNVITGFN